jgi:hypothetical protein
MSTQAEAEKVAGAMEALGQAWRGDWSFFDGRTLRNQMEELAKMVRAASAGEPMTGPVASFIAVNGICTRCGSWLEYCDCERAGLAENAASRENAR